MRWTRGYRSHHVEDRRASGPSARRAGGIGGLLWLFSRFGLPGLLIGGALLYFAGGLGTSSSTEPDGRSAPGARSAADPEEEEAVQFVSFVLDDVQNTWSAALGDGRGYRPARLVLFRGRTESRCGLGDAATGPFYCPRDERVYIDLSFYDELRQRFGAPGDFAQAYVIAHEIGHHVQHVLGTDRRLDEAPRGQLEGEGSASVRLELQADCLAGIWARSTRERDLLERGDVEEALGAAAAIGDDRLQRQSTGTVSPETFTHGSSEQRMRWFQRGFEQGTLQACDTFAADAL